jgi:O-antigen/teichoic acid export membrane protein
VLKAYTGNHNEVYIAWMILVAINAYSFYTFYYDSLMQGQGLIKRAKQIQIVGQSIYLLVAVVLILLRFNLIAVVSAQALSILVRRILSYRIIYTADFKRRLHSVEAQSRKEIIKQIYPNAVKLGLTGLGSFFVSKSAIIIGALYLPLASIASYGITIQIIGIISGIAGVYSTTYFPKITQYRIHNNKIAIKQIYLKSCLLLLYTFVAGGLILLFLGDRTLNLIGSNTSLLAQSFIVIALIIVFLDANHGIAASVLITNNEIPFLKPSLFAGAITLILLFIFLKYAHWGIWGMILAPGIAQACYQNWKWPMEVIKELDIKIF